MKEKAHELWELKQMQSVHLQGKIAMTQSRIIDWTNFFRDNVYVSFSGGKDSSVLLDITRKCNSNIEAVFVDTGLEYPEVRRFVKTFDNVTWLRPKMNFVDVIKKYGYPFISKEVAKIIYYYRQGSPWAKQYLKGKNTRGELDDYKKSYIKYKPLLDLPINFSHKCCLIMKEEPIAKYEQKNNKKAIIGTMADESLQRQSGWLKSGCNAFDSKRPTSKPMSFWTEQDVLEYITQNNIKIPSVYGNINKTNKKGNIVEGTSDYKLTCSGCQRTGCVFCGFGSHLDTINGGTGRFVRLHKTHPKLYNYCMNGGEFSTDGIWQPNKKGLGMKYVIDELNKLYNKTLKDGTIKKFIEY